MTAEPYVPPQNIEAEESVLGALMVNDAIGAVMVETRLAPEHFYRERHRLIFRAMQKLADAGSPIDALTVTERLGGSIDECGGKGYVSALASTVPVAGNVLHYAEIVAAKARWRARLAAGHGITEAAKAEDEEAMTKAEELLATEVEQAAVMYDEEAQAELLWQLLEGQAAPEFAWPFDGLNRASGGGMRRGQIHALGGYTGHGKSLLAGQLLDINRKRGKRVCLYDNEMTVEEQVARRATRVLGIPANNITGGKLSSDEKRGIIAKIGTIPGWPIVPISGWSADEVCRHMRLERWDLAVVDMLHNFDFETEAELSSMMSKFKAAAGRANTCIILVCHVNRGGFDKAKGKVRPPTRHDLRWSGSIENLAHTVTFVYREHDNEYDPPKMLPESFVYYDKNRGGKTVSIPTVLNETKLRFELRPKDSYAEPLAVAA